MRRSYPRQYKSQQTPLGKLLREARLKARLSQAQLAETIGISRPFLSQLESGRYLQPAPETLQRIAEVLSISREDLYALTGYTAPSGLPDFRAYLHAKYALPDAAIDELSDYFEFIRTKHAARRRPHQDNLTSETSGSSPAA
jgi:transcriptional regulator with XRE-family HTH domain